MSEVKRVINAMPDYLLGKQKEKDVTISYSLPILFMVPGDNSETDQNKSGNGREDDIEVPYAVIEEAPYFLTCQSSESNEDRKRCTSDEIGQFVNKNFNVNLANDLGLKGMQRISVIFKIGKDGVITDIRSRASHPELEKEAIRVIGQLPKMQPGKQRGKAVVVPYSLPILFQVNEAAPKVKN
ncbi:energy transducer TonB [Gelidibacter salicanalis]|uniref:Energy transducer TonB n=2 Tax=Gelidibacter salicanalis TaxID=291193 RepID=A0A934NI12_9FLAO|nr:energy transducer TonB [Gelidibacter salicanalis]